MLHKNHNDVDDDKDNNNVVTMNRSQNCEENVNFGNITFAYIILKENFVIIFSSNNKFYYYPEIWEENFCYSYQITFSSICIAHTIQLLWIDNVDVCFGVILSKKEREAFTMENDAVFMCGSKIFLKRSNIIEWWL